MSKSSFNALVEAKKQRNGVKTEEIIQTAEKAANKPAAKKAAQKNDLSKETKTAKVDNQTENPRPSKRETVRRSYRVDESHDKAVKIISKFMGQGTEEEIVLNIFAYFFENNVDGKKALQMVELLESK